jgi:hypothetical protein
MISTAPNSLARHLRVPGYLFFGIAMILPVLDLLISIYPFRIGTVVWRFAAVGLLSSSVGAPLLVLFFVFALALFAGDRRVVIAVGVIATLVALLLISSSGSFVLDALQMKRRVQAAAQQRFMLASAQAMLKLILQSITSIVLALSAFRALSKAKIVAQQRSEPRGSAALVMGRQSSSRPVVAPVAAPMAAIEAPAPPAAVSKVVDE